MTSNKQPRAILASFLYVLALLSVPTPPARAEDIDIFTRNPNVASQRPNVLIIQDNSANWNTPFDAEKAALVSTVQGLDERFNLGLMNFVETGGGNTNVDGSFVRFGVRQMTVANKTALANLVNAYDRLADASNNAVYGLTMAEAYRYFAGLNMTTGQVKRDAAGNSVSGCASCSAQNDVFALPGNALASMALGAPYVSPVSDNCQKNFIIFISNGPANDNAQATSEATTALAGYGGNTAQIPLNPSGSQDNVGDEWARFIGNSDLLASRPGIQTITTYTVDVNPGSTGQGPGHTKLLKSMAHEGNGKYFEVTTNAADIAAALDKIFSEILAINSVFAASTLPVSVNVRGTFLNQVYMGVFRPDAEASPRWPGNVKQFKLGVLGGDVVLVDKNNLAIENTTTGFISPAVVSFWTTTSSFWDIDYYEDAVADTPSTSDSPDGEFVEKGGAAQRLRTTFRPSPDPDPTTIDTRKLYTCIGCAADTDLTSSSATAFSTANGSLDAVALGITGAVSVSSLTRSGGTATATATAHGFTNNQLVGISGADQGDYNITQNITVVDANTFTYPVTERPVSPATAASGQTLQAAKGTGAKSVTGITLSGSTATATTTIAHGMANGTSVTVTGPDNASFNAYYGTYTITSVPDATTFTYTLNTTPATPATSVSGATAVANGRTQPITLVQRTTTAPGTLVTVTVANNFLNGEPNSGTVVISNVVPAEYNGTFAYTKDTNTRFFITLNATAIGPTTPNNQAGVSADASIVRTITLLTRPSGSGTVTASTSPVAHTYITNDSITISGASDSLYNGTFTITSTGTDTFTYSITPQPPSPATGTITATGGGNVTRDNLIKWVRGTNVQGDDNPSLAATAVRGYLHGDVLHSRPAVINYNRAGQPADRDLVVYYGSNAGVIHAVKGGQDDTDGVEKWGFIPSEFYTGFARLYHQLPVISSANPRTYFADGPISLNAVYHQDTSTTPPTERMEGAGAYAQIYVGMRRGGRFYYSLDVTSPDVPVYKWKIDNSTPGFSELGQSWSEAKVVKLRLTTCPGGAEADGTCRVLVFGGGYDAAANDPATQGTATMGRAIYVVGAKTGALIWFTGPTPEASMTVPSGAKYVQTGGASGMNYAIPADLSVISTDIATDVEGLADRIYAADTGANIWRVNISDPDPANWTIGKLASLGGSGVNARKFLFAPDVVAFDATNDSVLIGSGDREHPFDITINNRFYMIKDSHGINDVPASPPVGEGDLCDLTSNNIQTGSATDAQADQTCLASSKGWFIRLGTGEKAVTGATTLGGTTIFATNTPESQVSTASGVCSSGLGLALIYAVSFKDATATIDFNGDGVLSGSERTTERPGGGFPPTAIPFATTIDGTPYEGAITGTQVLQPPSSPVGQRYRVFWNLSVDN